MNKQTQEQIGDRRIRLALAFLLSLMLTLTAAWVNSGPGTTPAYTDAGFEKTSLPAGSTRRCPPQVVTTERDATAAAIIPKEDIRHPALITFRMIAKAVLENVEPKAKIEGNPESRHAWDN